MIELTQEQREEVMRSEEFLKFLEKSTKMLEKTLDDPCDITKDYAADMELSM
jgi:hypothetical protein